MKASPALAARITEAVASVDCEARRDQYRRGDFARSDKVKDLNKRYRWDLWWSAMDASDRSLCYAVCDADLSDAHLDTVLRKAVPTL